MARFAKTIGAFVAVVALGATLSTAEAGGGGGGGGGGWGGGKSGGGGWGGGGKTWGGGYGKGYGWGKGYGYGVPLAVGLGGLAVGAVAADAYYSGDECYVRRQRMMDDYGNVFVRRVRVCE
jgi:hypothetical protein